MENVEECKKTRTGFIDVFRGFGILLMVMGHIYFGYRFHFFIHAFHMPMFFWISGFFYKHKSKDDISFPAYIGKKAKSLLLPYAAFGSIYFALSAINDIRHHTAIDFSPLLHLVTDNSTGLPFCGALWFLTALFFADIVFFLIDRYIKNDITVAVIVFLISTFGTLASRLPFVLPFSLGAALVGTGLLYIGFLFRKYASTKVIHAIMNLSWVKCILLALITTLLIFVNGYINMREGTYSIIPLFWLNAILSIIVGFNLSRLLYPFLKKCRIGTWIEGIGRNSIVYVCTNEIIILMVKIFLTIIVRDFVTINIHYYLLRVIVLGCTLFILWLTALILTKTKLRFLIGK